MSIALRLIALILVTMALMLLGADLITTLETGKFTTRSLGNLWMLLDKTEPAAFYTWAEHHLPSLLASSSKVLLSLWGWAITGPIGCLLLLVLGRRTED
jgi:hypothetical protein